ncbi:MAG: ferrous iron transport protein A [Tissierellia bacterium]|nr:ferrous iron transport protein A [Tissierellia bacterium]
MLPLSIGPTNSALMIKKISGKDDQKKLLANMGFVPGEVIKLISQNDGNVIVGIKDGRVAIAEKMARRIMVEEVKHANLR